MNSLQNSSDLTPQALSGILVCDALTPRDGTAGSNQKLTADNFGQQRKGRK